MYLASSAVIVSLIHGELERENVKKNANLILRKYINLSETHASKHRYCK